MKKLLKELEKLSLLTEEELEKLAKAFGTDAKWLEKIGIVVKKRILGRWVYIVNEYKLKKLLK